MMEEGFWQARWQRNQIGFHRQEVNPGLKKYWPTLQVAPGRCVFVPLCGKSLDLLWLAEQGYCVLGVELIEKAVVDFFAEHKMSPTVIQQGAFKRYSAGSISILCGDFFALSADDLAAAKAALTAGVDVDMMATIFANGLTKLVHQGAIDTTLIDQAVLRVLSLKNDLGLFENQGI